MPDREEVLVDIAAGRTLRIYDPATKLMAVIDGKPSLVGYVEMINGVEWVRFPTQRHYGVPLVNNEETEKRVDIDLRAAEYFGDVVVTREQGKRHAAE